MYFKLELILKLSLCKEFEIRLEDSELPGLVLRFSSVLDETDKRYGSDLCTVLTEITPSTKVAGLLQNPSKPLPMGLQDFADNLEDRLYDAAKKAVKLLRWFRGDCGHNPMGQVKGLMYSPDRLRQC